MRKMKSVFRLLWINWRTMTEFEVLYKLLSMTIFTPVFWGIFKGIMRLTGYEYLTIENVLSFLTDPLTIAALLALFVCMAVYSMIDIGAVIFLLDQSYQGKKADLVQTARLQSRERLALVMETICSTGIRVSEVRYLSQKEYTGRVCGLIFDTVSKYRGDVWFCGQHLGPGVYHGLYQGKLASAASVCLRNGGVGIPAVEMAVCISLFYVGGLQL